MWCKQAAVAVAERKDVGQSRMSATTATAAANSNNDSKAVPTSNTAHSDAKGMPPTDTSSSNANNSSDAAQRKHDDTDHANAINSQSYADKSTDDDAKADAKGDVTETVRSVTDTTTTAAEVAEAKQSSRRSSAASNGVQYSDSKSADTAEQHAAAASSGSVNSSSADVMTRDSDDVAIVDSPLLESDLPNQLNSELSVQVIETVVTHPDTTTATANTAIRTSTAAAVEKPVHLSIESTPEFMQLPLEFQGFCPWTIVHRRGLLLAGRPELGVQRWRGAHYVFAHKVAAAVSAHAYAKSSICDVCIHCDIYCVQ
jgi:Domain of unknown function